MALFLITASRTIRSSLSRQPLFFHTSRLLSTQTNNDFHTTNNQQYKNESSSTQEKPRRRYRYYLLSIGIGALIGTVYTLRQSRKYEGLMPEYMSNSELLERQAMEARPSPTTCDKTCNIRSATKREFPFENNTLSICHMVSIPIYSTMVFEK